MKDGEGDTPKTECVVLVTVKDKSCAHCLRGLEFIATLLNPKFNPEKGMVEALPER